MNDDHRQHEIRRVLIIVLIANLLVAGFKLTIGALTGALSILADGFHSALDATSNIVGLIGIAIASQPPDPDHPYGHRRFETLASMVIGGMLLLTAWELIQSVIQRLQTGDSPEITPLAFVVMVVTLLVNIGVTRYEAKVGRSLRSELLTADATHTQSDVIVSLSVIVGLIIVQLGIPQADAIVALLVVIVLGIAAWRIVGEAAAILVDRVALDPDSVSRLAEEVSGVATVTRVRSRGPADDVHLDVNVEVAGPMTAAQTASIATEVRRKLRGEFDGLSDIQITFAPGGQGNGDYMLLARAEADALGLAVHEVIAATTERGLTMELHVEVDPQQTVAEAHRVVSLFEGRMKARIPSLERIVSHIEPAHAHEHNDPNSQVAWRLAEQAIDFAQSVFNDGYWHDLDIRHEEDGGYAISMHCHMYGDMTIAEAHRIAETVETQIRAAYPQIHRVTIHTEPQP